MDRRFCDERNCALDHKVGTGIVYASYYKYSACSGSSSSSDGDGNNGSTSGDRGGGGSSSSRIVAIAAGVVDCISSNSSYIVAVAAGVVYSISSSGSRLCDGSNTLNYNRLMYFTLIFTFCFLSLHDESI